MPITAFIAAQTKVSGGDAERSARGIAERSASGLRSLPVIDGELIVRSPLQALRDGVGTDIPVALLFTAEEFDFLARDAARFRTGSDLSVEGSWPGRRRCNFVSTAPCRSTSPRRSRSRNE